MKKRVSRWFESTTESEILPEETIISERNNNVIFISLYNSTYGAVILIEKLRKCEQFFPKIFQLIMVDIDYRSSGLTPTPGTTGPRRAQGYRGAPGPEGALKKF